MPGDSIPASWPLARSSSKTRAGEGDVAGDADPAALYRELRKPLLRYLFCLGLSTDEAQDVLQDVFLRLQRHIAAGGSQDNIRSWLYRVAHNQTRNHQRRYDRRFVTSFNPDLHRVIDEETPERAVLNREKDKEKLQKMANAVRLLSVSERECLVLRAGGLRYRQIGEVLGISVSTVSDIVTRALKKLAENCNV